MDKSQDDTKSKMAWARLPQDEYDRLAETAKTQDRSVAWIIREAIRQYLNRRKVA